MFFRTCVSLCFTSCHMCYNDFQTVSYASHLFKYVHNFILEHTRVSALFHICSEMFLTAHPVSHSIIIITCVRVRFSFVSSAATTRVCVCASCCVFQHVYHLFHVFTRTHFHVVHTFLIFSNFPHSVTLVHFFHRVPQGLTRTHKVSQGLKRQQRKGKQAKYKKEKGIG